MVLANENKNTIEDRKLFVHNLGLLLSQTRNNIASCELDDYDIVTILYARGCEKQVNVACDSYTAIIKDVVKNLGQENYYEDQN